MDQPAIKAVIEDVLQRMRIEISSIQSSTEGTHTTYAIESPDARLLIGNHGDNLDALSYIIRRLVERQVPAGAERPVFVVDVNNYQAKKIKELTDSVELSVRRAKLFRQDVDLPPMTSYERMIIHNAFSADEEISTESAGEGKFRHIVLRYKARPTTTVVDA